MAVLVLVVGCSAERRETQPDGAVPLSCADSVSHYYAVGCAFAIPFDSPNQPEPIAEQVFMNTCLAIRDRAPACAPMLDALTRCAAEATVGSCTCQALYANMHC